MEKQTSLQKMVFALASSGNMAATEVFVWFSLFFCKCLIGNGDPDLVKPRFLLLIITFSGHVVARPKTNLAKRFFVNNYFYGNARFVRY